MSSPAASRSARTARTVALETGRLYFSTSDADPTGVAVSTYSSMTARRIACARRSRGPSAGRVRRTTRETPSVSTLTPRVLTHVHGWYSPTTGIGPDKRSLPGDVMPPPSPAGLTTPECNAPVPVGAFPEFDGACGVRRFVSSASASGRCGAHRPEPDAGAITAALRLPAVRAS